MHPSLQTLPASVQLLIAQCVSPPLLKHAFRAPGYRFCHRSLLAASSTCHALRRVCFPLAIRVFRNHDPKPLARADIGASAHELEKRIEWALGREDLWPYIKMVDIELFARGSPRLGTRLVTFLASLPHLESLAIRLPTFHVFRTALVSDLRACLTLPGFESVRTLCVDSDAAWLVPLFPHVRELVVWTWPRPGCCDDEEEEEDWASGWSVVLGSLSAQAPNVSELEIGGLSIWDVNEVFPAFANALGQVRVLRVLHRSEPYGSVPLDHAPSSPLRSPSVRTARLGPRIQSSTRTLWQDALVDPEYQGRYIRGPTRALERIVYFGWQDECGSCYVPVPGVDHGWKDVGPVVVLSLRDMKDRS
ncbi:hypothetical protein RSOLAG22IIIB_08987 [Rhizoctonia solani]|uniref:Uncharacterized protein n=1 Tax=Rhizoctonia solani TaxID=456999 RepID=A0A0K6FX57_9AGAM|nr:hypothetical protein RSOLAG22IIIB_08987 [Rhizoctonia solani]